VRELGTGARRGEVATRAITLTSKNSADGNVGYQREVCALLVYGARGAVNGRWADMRRAECAIRQEVLIVIGRYGSCGRGAHRLPQGCAGSAAPPY
jgi:hypothetical protein